MFKPKDYDDFEKLISDFDWQLLTSNPHSDDVQDWIAKVNGILWDFDSPSSNELNNFGTINHTIAETVKNITKLTNIVTQSSLDENEKRQLIGDIETVKAQIIKPKPDKSILQKSWDAVQTASIIGGAAQLLGLIGQVVLPLLK